MIKSNLTLERVATIEQVWRSGKVDLSRGDRCRVAIFPDVVSHMEVSDEVPGPLKLDYLEFVLERRVHRVDRHGYRIDNLTFNRVTCEGYEVLLEPCL